MFGFAPWQNHFSFIQLICLVADWLYIKAVRIGTIDGVLIKPFQSLIIRKHWISVIEDDALVGLAELAVLKIMECGLPSMPPVFDVKDTLYELYLNTNNISYVANDYFRGFKRLYHLSLADNSLTELPDLTVLKTTLQILHAEINIIKHFPNWMLNMSMEKLSYLHISQNRIQEFSSTMLSLQRQLQYIDLSLNDLRTVPQYHDVTWVTTVEVIIKDNPLHCNSSLAWLTSTSRAGNGDIITGAIRYNGGHCETPKRLRGRFLTGLGW